MKLPCIRTGSRESRRQPRYQSKGHFERHGYRSVRNEITWYEQCLHEETYSLEYIAWFVSRNGVTDVLQNVVALLASKKRTRSCRRHTQSAINIFRCFSEWFRKDLMKRYSLCKDRKESGSILKRIEREKQFPQPFLDDFNPFRSFRYVLKT